MTVLLIKCSVSQSQAAHRRWRRIPGLILGGRRVTEMSFRVAGAEKRPSVRIGQRARRLARVRVNSFAVHKKQRGAESEAKLSGAERARRKAEDGVAGMYQTCAASSNKDKKESWQTARRAHSSGPLSVALPGRLTLWRAFDAKMTQPTFCGKGGA